MYGVLGIGVAFVIITAGIDLSIGSLVCLAACLLAIFLKVDYQPFDVQRVLAVTAADRSIVLEGADNQLKAGDKIRYYGGRRARSAIAEVITAEQTITLDGRAATKLTIDQPLSRDDTDGKVASLLEIESFDAGDVSDPAAKRLPTITLRGALTQLARRDQIWFVHPISGIKQLKVVESQIVGDTTQVTVNDSLGSFDKQWMAIPLERRQRFPIPIAVGLVLGIAFLLGSLHGLLVTKLKLQPFVVTLCGLLFYRGISRWLVSDQTMGFGDEFTSSLSLLGNGKLPIWQAADGSDSFGIPYPFFVLILTALVAAVFLNKTIWGRYMLALGRNEEAARYSGINTDRMTLLAYVISSAMAAVGGILFALDSNSVAPSSFGNFFELYAIAAAVLGGCSLRGGEGGIFGVVVGTALMQTLYNLIVLVKISDKLEFAIIGAVILIGVIADELVKRIASKRRAARQREATA